MTDVRHTSMQVDDAIYSPTTYCGPYESRTVGTGKSCSPIEFRTH